MRIRGPYPDYADVFDFDNPQLENQDNTGKEVTVKYAYSGQIYTFLRKIGRVQVFRFDDVEVNKARRFIDFVEKYSQFPVELFNWRGQNWRGTFELNTLSVTWDASEYASFNVNFIGDPI